MRPASPDAVRRDSAARRAVPITNKRAPKRHLFPRLRRTTEISFLVSSPRPGIPRRQTFQANLSKTLISTRSPPPASMPTNAVIHESRAKHKATPHLNPQPTMNPLTHEPMSPLSIPYPATFLTFTQHGNQKSAPTAKLTRHGPSTFHPFSTPQIPN